MTKLKGGAGGRVWGHRPLVVISWVGKVGVERMSINIKALSEEVVVALVKGVAVFLRLRKEVENVSLVWWVVVAT